MAVTHYTKNGLDGPEVRAVRENEENPKEHNLSEDQLDSDNEKDDKRWGIGDMFGKSDSKSHDFKPSSSSTFTSSSDSKSSGETPWTKTISDWFKSDSKDSNSSFKSKSISARGDAGKSFFVWCISDAEGRLGNADLGIENVKYSEPLTDAKNFVDEKLKDLKDWIDKMEKQGHQAREALLYCGYSKSWGLSVVDLN